LVILPQVVYISLLLVLMQQVLRVIRLLLKFVFVIMMFK